MACPAIPPFPPTTLSSLRFLVPLTTFNNLASSKPRSKTPNSSISNLEERAARAAAPRLQQPVWVLRPALPLQLPAHHFLPHPFSATTPAPRGLSTLNPLRRSPEHSIAVRAHQVEHSSLRRKHARPFFSLLPRLTVQTTPPTLPIGCKHRFLHPKAFNAPPLGSSHSRPLLRPHSASRLRLP
ncbi:hypothetical protein DFP72DRAFT_918793, partial [Ephemerocybe angulata]